MIRYFLLFLSLGFSIISANAQFYHFPLPIGEKDHRIAATADVKICYEYKVEAGEKMLYSILEYGAEGLPVVWYEKGVNEEGDSITLAETQYSYFPNHKLKTLRYEVFEEYMADNSITNFTYDDKERLINKEILVLDPNVYNYKYDEAGCLKEAIVSIRLATFDDEGNFTGNYVDDPQLSTLYRCDSKGRIIEEKVFLFENGKISSLPQYQTQWFYNEKGQVIQIIQLDSEGAELGKAQMEYNEQGLLKRMINLFDNVQEEEFIYEYCTDCKQSWMQ